jgi:preprotein translocase subunit YajC
MLNLINLAQAQEATSEVTSKPQSVLMNLLPLVLIFAVFYVFIIRPQNRKLKEHQRMIKAIGKGDKVVTGGGIVATVIKVEPESNLLHLEIADQVKIKVRWDTITEVIKEKAATA